MKVRDVVEKLDLLPLTGEIGMDKDISGVFICDLLSWAMAHTDRGNIWITVHTHLNVVAVAVLSELSCVIIPEAIAVEAPTIERAVNEGVALISTKMTGYETCCRLYELFKHGG